MTTLPLSAHKREVLRAWLDGRTIQLSSEDGRMIQLSSEDGRTIQLSSEDGWLDWKSPSPPKFDSKDEDYRIRTTPARRFWLDGEIPLGFQAREIGSSCILMIVAVGPGYAMLSMGLEINATNYMKYVIAPPGPANSVAWVPAGVEE